MRHRYIEFNGRKFKFQNDLDFASNFFDLVLAYGDEALRALQHLEGDAEYSELLQQLLEQGLLEKVKGRFRLTPRAASAMQRKALMEVFAYLKKGRCEGHASPERGGDAERSEETRPYQFGDPVSELDLSATLRNALRRMAEEGTQARRHAGTQSGAGMPPGHVASAPPALDAATRCPGRARRGPRDDAGTHESVTTGLDPPPALSLEGRRSSLLPLRIHERDFERYEAESRASCSIVVLLDQSGSMARFGRFIQAKKCAMALIALVRQSFPSDTVDLVGFASAAEVIPEERLPLLMPKPVTTYDPVIRLRVPLNRIDQAPPHFTNLHLGLLQAGRLLQRRSGDNKLIFIITDGQPTAHVQGDYVHLLYPPDKASHIATLKEAFLIARRDVRLCTFALTDDYWDMDWLGFVDDLGRVTRGVTFHCTSGELSACVMESYLSGRRRKTYIA